MAMQGIVDIEDTVRLVMRVEVVAEDLSMLRLLEVLTHCRGFKATIR